MKKEKPDIINNAIIFLKGIQVVYNGFESGVFLLPNQLLVLAEPETSSSSEHPTSSEKSSSPENSSDYYKYISPEEKISGRRLKLLNPKKLFEDYQ